VIAALYIDPRGPYPQMADVDCWDEARDARNYTGPHSIVAHPSCKQWGRMRHLAHSDGCTTCGSRGGWDLQSGARARCAVCLGTGSADRSCAPRAVQQVRTYGGVLEHPEGSLLWSDSVSWLDEFLPLPQSQTGYEPNDPLNYDSFGGYTIELDQCEWGHVARKPTWLYLVGVPRSALESPPYPGRKPTHYASGGRTKSSRKGGAVPAGMKVCSAQQRRRTPPLLAEYLVRLAQAAAEARKAA
jgi:hypothetical protein